MKIISNTINALDPGQIPNDWANRPIFILTLGLMIWFSYKFGPGKYFSLFTFLHPEKLLFINITQVIKSRGLDEIITKYGLPVFEAASLVTVSDIKRARYCVQVGVCVIYSKLKQSLMNSGSDELILS